MLYNTKLRFNAYCKYLVAMFPQMFFLLSKTFLYWLDISATWAKTFFMPDLYSAHRKKKVCNF